MTSHSGTNNSLIDVFAVFLFFAITTTSLAKEPRYAPPKTPDGRPDLQGVWDQNNLTPLERPPGFISLVIDADQAKRIEALVMAPLEDRSIPTEPTEYWNARDMKRFRGEYRSSLIVDPPDGRLPWLPIHTGWAAKIRWNTLNAMEGPEQRPTSERCLGNPAAQPPIINNPGMNLRQIVQTKDTLVIWTESGHHARVIRINSAHPSSMITSWLGDSIGWWEGETFVVETKNFSPNDTGRAAQPNAFLISERATVIERFTRASDDELHYEFTVDDPVYYSRTWKGEYHFARSTDRLFDDACHEGNRSMVYILQGARVRDGEWPVKKPD